MWIYLRTEDPHSPRLRRNRLPTSSAGEHSAAARTAVQAARHTEVAGAGTAAVPVAAAAGVHTAVEQAAVRLAAEADTAVVQAAEVHTVCFSVESAADTAAAGCTAD